MPGGCPAAIAIQETTGLYAEVYILLGIDFFKDQHQIAPFAHRRASNELVEFIRAFDHNRPVQPFTFEIDVPELTD